MEADGPAPKVLLADKGYDADFIREDMKKRGGVAMIPTKRNRLVQLPVAKSEARAEGLYEQACTGGDAGGCSNLGYFYAQGRGVAKDEARAAGTLSTDLHWW